MILKSFVSTAGVADGGLPLLACRKLVSDRGLAIASEICTCLQVIEGLKHCRSQHMLKLVYHRKHMASPGTHQVSSISGTDKDCREQGICTNPEKKSKERKAKHDRKKLASQNATLFYAGHDIGDKAFT